MSTSIVLIIIVAEAYSVASADGCDLMGVRLWLLGNDRRGTRFLVFAAAFGLFHNHASAGTLVHLRSVVWGCVDPNVAASINNSSNPNLSDPQWVAHATQVGQCVTIGTESSWETLSPDFNGLTYVAYRGTVGKPGSFWVPTAAIDFNVPQPVSLPPVTTTNLPAPEPPAPPTPPSLPTPLTSPEPTAAPEATGIAAQTVSAESQPSPTTPTPISPAPEPPDSASTTATTTGDQNGSLGGILGVLALLAIAALIRRSRRLKVKAKRRVPQVETSKPKPTTSVREHPASPAQTPALSGSARPPLSRATNEVQPPKQPGSGSARQETRLGTTIPNEPALTWYGPGDRVTVLGATVADGMVYIGAASGAGGQHDASFINPSLPIASSSVSAGPLGYWPSYGSVTPECRRRYLEWLASGKRDPDADIGYVFLYFYGLERRLLIEAPAREEVRALVAEIQRLRTIYDGNRSFAGYSSRLLDAMLLLHDLPSAESRFVPDLSAPLGDMAPALKVAIAREVVADRPLSFELSAAALCGLSEFSSQHRQVLDKGRPAFLAVLESRFRKTFPSGFPLRNRKDSRLQLVYRGALAGLEVNIAARVGLTTLPDPATLTWTKLLALAGAVAEEVAPYVKALAYHPARANSLAALIGCPAELRNTVALEARQWLESLPSPTAVRFGVLAKNAIGAGSVKWTVRHQRQVGEVLSALGYAMEPDPLEGVERLEDETQVQVFRCAGSARSRAMDVAGAAAMLVAAVAKTAPDAAETSAEFWLSRLPSRLSLTVDETTRLRARLAWLSTKTATLAKAMRLLGDSDRGGESSLRLVRDCGSRGDRNGWQASACDA